MKKKKTFTISWIQSGICHRTPHTTHTYSMSFSVGQSGMWDKRLLLMIETPAKSFGKIPTQRVIGKGKKTHIKFQQGFISIGKICVEKVSIFVWLTVDLLISFFFPCSLFYYYCEINSNRYFTRKVKIQGTYIIYRENE